MIAAFLVAASILSAAALFLYLARLAIECRAREREAYHQSKEKTQ